MSPIYIQIFKKPTAGVIKAASLRGYDTQSKHDATVWLEGQINSGKVSIDQVIAQIDSKAPSKAPASFPALAELAQDIATVRGEAKSLTESLENQLGNAVKVFSGKVSNIENNLRHDLFALQSDVRAVKSQQVIDPSEVARAVAREVQNAFAPFKQSVIDAQAESVVSHASGAIVVDRKPVGEVFGVPINDMKGNPLMVDLWNAQDAPAIDPNFVWTELDPAPSSFGSTHR
jgi:hypothetical protein